LTRRPQRVARPSDCSRATCPMCHEARPIPSSIEPGGRRGDARAARYRLTPPELRCATTCRFVTVGLVIDLSPSERRPAPTRAWRRFSVRAKDPAARFTALDRIAGRATEAEKAEVLYLKASCSEMSPRADAITAHRAVAAQFSDPLGGSSLLRLVVPAPTQSRRSHGAQRSGRAGPKLGTVGAYRMPALSWTLPGTRASGRRRPRTSQPILARRPGATTGCRRRPAVAAPEMAASQGMIVLPPEPREALPPSSVCECRLAPETQSGRRGRGGAPIRRAGARGNPVSLYGRAGGYIAAGVAITCSPD